jgi:hypothetical protein
MYRICNVDLDVTAEAMAARMPGEKARSFLEWYRRHGTLSAVVQSDFPDIYEEAVGSGSFPPDPKAHGNGFDMQGIHGLSRKGFAYVFGPHVRGSCLDPRDTSSREMDANGLVKMQLELVRRIPGLERAELVQVATSLGVRASRHITCEYMVTKEDVAGGSRFPDAVGQGSRYVKWLEARQVFKGKAYKIPYRALLPLGVEGLLIGGRSVSRANIRGMVNCAVMGEACGTAASMCASMGVGPRELPVPQLQDRLRSRGAILGALD